MGYRRYHRRARSGPSLCLLLMVALFCMLRAHAASDHEASEYQVKAAYLYQFLNFVSWPESATPAPNTPFQICVLGVDPFAADLDNIVRGKRVHGHYVHVQRMSSPSSTRGCHILFISASERNRLALVLEAVAGLPLLTVSELQDFERKGGMIRFVLEHENVRLRINPDTSAAAGLQISAKLLAVATVVRGHGGG
jgi:YfiR/HmsC-like